jgi:hypothetical protein
MAWLRYVRALIRLGRTAEAEAVLEEMVARFGAEAVLAERASLGVEIIIMELGAATQVLILFGAGLALPASKWGGLTLNDDRDRDAWYALIVAVYKRHVGERNAYRDGDRTRTITELWADADYLWPSVRAFSGRYPKHESASLLRMIERAAGGWVHQYWRQDDDWYTPQPSQPVPPPPPIPPPEPVAPRPVGRPHMVERPTSYEDSVKEQAKADAQRKRERIARIRERVRELRRKRRDPAYDYRAVLKEIDGYIEALLMELQKLRDDLTEADEDTGEDMDEPIELPPPAPLPQWPLGHPAQGYRLYVKPGTNQQDWFVDPPGGEWAPASDYHWGWAPEVDPNTGKIIWRPGWAMGGASEDARAVHLMGVNPMRFETSTMLPAAATQRAASTGLDATTNRRKERTPPKSRIPGIRGQRKSND